MVENFYRSTNIQMWISDATDKYHNEKIGGALGNQLKMYDCENKFPCSLTMWIGMRVMITTKIYRQYDIAYGSFGLIKQIYCNDDRTPNCILIYHKESNVMFPGLEKGIFPYFVEKHSTKIPKKTPPKSSSNLKKNAVYTLGIQRFQFGFISAYAITDYKSQPNL
jgi:hypothetical protein